MGSTKFIFVGGVFPKEEEQDILRKSKRRPQMAANNYQWSLINGFDSNMTTPVSIFNRKYVGSYPKNYTDMIVKGKNFSHTTGANDIDLGFINISVLRNFFPPFSEKKYIKKILKSNSQNVFFFYSIGRRNLKLAEYIKKKSPNSINVFYIPDLPQFVMLSVRQSLFVKIHRSILTRNVEKSLKSSDINVLITRHQAESLGVEQNSCIVIEGFAVTENRHFVPIDNTEEFNIVYAGTLARQYDILDLVRSFQKITDSHARLFICGDGDAVEDIIEAQKTDERISYLGVLNQDQLLELYSRAALLVNPRRKSKGFTRYSFPSKTIDYMLAGRPVLCQKLEGIPNEYDDYLIYFDNDEHSHCRLEDMITEIMTYSKEKLNRIGERNFEFIVANKSAKSQTKKIIDFIKKKFPGVNF